MVKNYKFSTNVTNTNISENPITLLVNVEINKKDGIWFWFENDFNSYIFSHNPENTFKSEKEIYDYVQLGWEEYLVRIQSIEDELKEEKKSAKVRIIELVNSMNN